LLVCAMGLAILVLLIYVLPKFTVMFSEMGCALPLQARVLLAVSEAVRGYWWAGIGAVGLVAGGFRYSIRTPRGRYEWDQWKLRLVLVGQLLRKMEVASLARTLGSLLKCGVPRLQATGIGMVAAGNEGLARSLAG